ncbi:DnaJ-related protein scj1 [Bonamia ostreae]|uniref:DnaJ-related protein scj1 n=1 Tax=Bonamia ostreae TaxID=126728 RepID=A0ABV2ATT4_9EUKA
MGADSEDNIHKCQKCKGEGVIPMYLQYGPGFVVKSEQKCDQCDGKGTIIKKKCPICKGRKLVTNKRKISFNVEKGLNDGDTIVLENEADESIAHKSGHLILTVKTIPHKRFVRKGNDLHFDHTVRLSQALLGFDIEIEGLAGEKIRLKREFITRPGFK